MIAVLVSGGKDSTATLLLALEKHGRKNTLPIFTDTGFESSETYRYLDYLERTLGVQIVRLKNLDGHDLLSLIRLKKRFPNSRMRFCTALLKQVPVALYLIERKDVKELWMGIRADESRRRKEKYRHISPEDTWEYAGWLSGNGYLRKSHLQQLTHIRCRFPIVDWTEEDVFRFLREKGVEPNPLYSRGHSRVGCFPCILSGWKDYQLCWQDEEGKRNILRLRELEEELNAQGYHTRLRDHATAKEVVRRLRLREAQLEMFGEECQLCRI